MTGMIRTFKMPNGGWVAWCPDLFQSIEYETEQHAIAACKRYLESDNRFEKYIEIYAALLSTCIVPYGSYYCKVSINGNRIAVAIALSEEPKEFQRWDDYPTKAGKKRIEIEDSEIIVIGDIYSNWSFASMMNDAHYIAIECLGVFSKPDDETSTRFMLSMFGTTAYEKYHWMLSKIRHHE